MPELPEVENIRLGLVRALIGQKILGVEVKKPKLVSGKGTLRKSSLKKKAEFVRGLVGERITSIERRAKNLIFFTSGGKVLLVHLKMTGQFVYESKSGKEIVVGGHPIEVAEHQLPNKHTHVIFRLEKGTLYYNDTRMFGYLLYYPSLKAFEAENHFRAHGIEPLTRSFNATYLFKALQDKKSKIKSVLMDQQIVTGLGNIYADESLHESGIRPDRISSSLTLSETSKLLTSIKRILKRAIQVGGSSVATYRLLDNSRGNYAREHKVYGKGNKPCGNCKNILVKTTIGGRTTIFCPHCQK